MVTTAEVELVPSRVLSGKRFVVVGGTGFLGKVWVSMLLTWFPEVVHLYLLVRAKEEQTAEERFWSQITTSPVFDALREMHPGPAFEAYLRSKVTPVDGDVAEPLLGLSGLLEELKGRIDAVVNVAGVVDFNPPLDEALEVNAFGVNNLAELAKAIGAKVLHTSTCYVAGYRSGLIEENDPREIPFPRAAGETWFGASCPKRTLDRSHWDPQQEISECLDLVKQARHRCEDAFRQSAFLDEAKHNLETRGEPCRGSALSDELVKVKRKFIKERLVEAGRERALFWGWPNIYTYTKSIGEQVLASSGVPFTIVRPAVIESSVKFPFPGWNEGINTSAPFLYMASKGQVQLPGDHAVHLDIIPVDMVASGMIAALTELLEGRAKSVYQCGTSDTNACRMTRYFELAGLYKRRQVFEGKRTKLFDHISARFESMGIKKNQYEAHGAVAIAGALRRLSGFLKKASVGPVTSLLQPARAALDKAAQSEEKLAEVCDLFIPFVAETTWVFSCANTRAAVERMPEDERARFCWDPESIDWRQWMFEVHLPGLEVWVYPQIEERLRREIKPLRPYDTLIDLVDEMADRHDHALALQRLEQDGLSRTSFRELRDAARATALRLKAIGVKHGDRVIVSGANQPAWPIAYFGILYAGAVAVPTDPDLDAVRLANIIRSSCAQVALWDEVVEDKVGAAIRKALPNLRMFDLPAFTEGPGPDERESLLPPDVRVTSEDLASIIYTSGTTGEPKGVMLTHANFTTLLASLIPLFPLSIGDRVLSVLPLHHTFEFTCGLLLPLSQGARIIYLDELTADKLSEGLEKGRITAMVGVPALWQMLERRIMAKVKDQGKGAVMAFNWAAELNRMLGKRLGISVGRLFFSQIHESMGGNVRFLISGGAALPKNTAKLFAGIGLPLSEGYGLTEAAPVLSVSKASARAVVGHVGKAIPGVEIRIDNPDANGVGEIVARGPNIMKGYADNPVATAQVLDQDGWLHTGDLGKLDAKKQLIVVGRQKDVIVAANGENVYPDDVETLLGTIEYVKELAIVGIDDGRGGERVACLAVPEEESQGEPAQGAQQESDSRKKRHLRALESLREAFAKLPKASQPAVVHLYEAELPRTATRKVKRPEVKAIVNRLVAATSRKVQEGDTKSLSDVRHAIAVIANRDAKELFATTSLKGDLAFDSLMTMELCVALEAQLGRPVDVAQFARCDTVADIERMLEGDGLMAQAEKVLPEEEQAPIVVPPALADMTKYWLTKAQMGFYDTLMRPKVTGRAFIPYNRNSIVVSNHASHLDMGFVKYALGSYGDGIVSLAAQDYFFESGRWRRAYFENFTNLAAFDRKNGLRQALRQASEILERGKTVLLFPEGTRSPDGAIHEFKPVVGHLVLTCEVDILPVYVGGTYEAWPKGRAIPTRRDIVARIGPPLEVTELKRLTAGMKLSVACRKVAELARRAVLALRDGSVLDIRLLESIDKEGPVKEHPLVLLFRELEGKYVAGRVSQPITYYFTLGAETEAKWTLRIDPGGCEAHPGKPKNQQADCVLKTSPEIFTKIVREAYTPSPMEFMTGAIKSNDVSLLQTFQKVFDLG